ncbi:MAG: hypothetical protein NWQ39_02555 [Saprospiraceae bacterium]|jgi:hypothetical protein|nr:hypothetical protein [Saprospiraceae bacterium]
MFDVPILFIVFNRPNITKLVFDRIRQIKPKYLFIHADGPRSWIHDDLLFSLEVRAIVSNIDWECDVKKTFHTENYGCGKAVSSAISWFFEHVDEGIILEDDCLPDLSFFSFCKENLAKHRDDRRIMHISGNNFHPLKRINEYSYYYSKYNHIWGWATWKKSWDSYKFNIDTGDISKQISSRKYPLGSHRYWKSIFLQTSMGSIDTWDYQWTYAMWKEGGLAIIPKYNLISNIGFGANATHTNDEDSYLSNLPVRPIEFPLVHPPTVSVSWLADWMVSKKHFNVRFFKNRFLNKFFILFFCLIYFFVYRKIDFK